MENWIKYKSNPEDIIVNSSVKLLRNFKNQKFINKQNIEEAKENIDNVYKLFSAEFTNEAPQLIKIWEQNSNDIEEYVEKKLISKKLLERKDKGAFIINNENTISIMLNEEDHIAIKCISGGLDLNNEYEFAMKVEDTLSKKYIYSFSETFGYLTMNPNNVGTGLIVSAVIHLPILTYNKKIDEISKNLYQEGILLEAIYKEDSKCYGNLYSIKNKTTLGKKEEDILLKMQKYIFELVKEEKKAREEILVKNEIDFEDRIYRSYGILKYARKLTSQESLQLISDVRLGIELKLIDIDKKIINEITINSRNSSITRKMNINKEIINLDIERCKIIRELLINT